MRICEHDDTIANCVPTEQIDQIEQVVCIEQCPKWNKLIQMVNRIHSNSLTQFAEMIHLINMVHLIHLIKLIHSPHWPAWFICSGAHGKEWAFDLRWRQVINLSPSITQFSFPSEGVRWCVACHGRSVCDDPKCFAPTAVIHFKFPKEGVHEGVEFHGWLACDYSTWSMIKIVTQTRLPG